VRQKGNDIISQAMVVGLTPTTDMDQETFKVMWDLSAPGSEAERCFLRLTYTLYNRDNLSKPHPYTTMPDVSWPLLCVGFSMSDEI
jgi:hypothetical protein